LERLLDGMDVLLSFTKINRSIMSNDKKSSIEWLEQELKKIPFVNVLEVFEQAKAMHKEEMCEFAFKVGRGQDYDDKEVRELSEIIYNETFGGNND